MSRIVAVLLRGLAFDGIHLKLGGRGFVCGGHEMRPP
jgi:hypothetical protein